MFLRDVAMTPVHIKHLAIVIVMVLLIGSVIYTCYSRNTVNTLYQNMKGTIGSPREADHSPRTVIANDATRPSHTLRSLAPKLFNGWDSPTSHCPNELVTVEKNLGRINEETVMKTDDPERMPKVSNIVMNDDER